EANSSYWTDPSEAFQPPFIGSHEHFAIVLPDLEFSDGHVVTADFNGASPVIAVQVGSVAAYATALDDYAEAIAAAPGANDGTSGEDDMRGSRSDDAISGGGGNDSFHSSGGSDTIDGGNGDDTLYLFGARLDFRMTLDPLTGDLTLEDMTGL